MSARSAELAPVLARAHRERRQITLPADLSLEEAYALQDAVFAELSGGKRPVAWKVGGPSDKVQPIGAPVLAVLPSPARMDGRSLNMIGVEVEIAFRIGADAAEEAMVAIEVCDTRLADFDGAAPMAKLADFQSNAALVTGSGQRRWREIDFRRQIAQLWIDGRKVRETQGAHSYGDPARLLPWAVAHCASRRNALQPGDVVTTGTWTGMEFARPGSEVRAVFPGVGEASLTLGA